MLCNITSQLQPLTTHATTAAATMKHVYSMSLLSANQYDALRLIKSLFGEAAATSRPKSRAVSSAEALGPPNEFQKEMNGEKKCERGGEKITVKSIKRIHIHHKAFRVFCGILCEYCMELSLAQQRSKSSLINDYREQNSYVTCARSHPSQYNLQLHDILSTEEDRFL